MAAKHGLAALLLALAMPAAAAPLQLDPVFTSSMVLQRGQPIRIAGDAAAGAEVRVALGNQLATARADAGGRWRVNLAPLAAGGPLALTVSSGGAQLQLNDIMIGDVWLCSGQSNMEFEVRQATNADAVIANSSNNNLRLFAVPRQSSAAPAHSFAAPVQWQRAGPASVAHFSAVCYFLGSNLQASARDAAGQPVALGLIAASWGGSIIQDWLPAATLRGAGDYGAGLELLALHSRDPAAAEAQWLAQLDSYFARADAAVPPTQWTRANVGAFWEGWPDAGLGNFDGSATYRATVRLTADEARAARAITLGAVDDVDLTLINGKRIGASMGWQTQRRYLLPAGTLHAGDNVITVKVLDTGGGGGLWGDTARAIDLADGRRIALSDWQFARGAALGSIGAPPYVPWLGGSGLTTLFNGMIAPLGDIALQGIAWYQGESNVSDPAGYARLLPALIGDWRQRFNAGPFLITQLANFGPPTSTPVDSAWAQLREVQRRTADADPAAGMAVTIDIGDRYDIHPTNKAEVGRRLALAARALLGGSTAEPRPMPAGTTRNGDRLVLRVTQPLTAYGNNRPTGFELCDGAGKCRFVDALLGADGTISMAVRSDDRELRYLWADNPLPNLYDAQGLPLGPFKLAI